MRTFFVDNPDQKLIIFQIQLEYIHSYASPHSVWTRSWLDWITLFVKLHTKTFIGAKFDNDMRTFFVDNLDQKLIMFQIQLEYIHSYASPHSVWTRPWLDWKTIFVKLHTETFIGAKFDRDISTLFVDNSDQKFLLFQNILGCIHSYSSTLFNWTSSWLDRKTLFVKLHTETFIGAKFDRDISTLFVDNSDQKFLLFHNLLVCIQSYSSPHSVWRTPWLDWKTLFVKLHTETFIGTKFDNDIGTFSWTTLIKNCFCFRTY